MASCSPALRIVPMTRASPAGDLGRRTADGPRHPGDQDRLPCPKPGGVHHGRPGGHVAQTQRSGLFGVEAVGTHQDSLDGHGQILGVQAVPAEAQVAPSSEDRATDPHSGGLCSTTPAKSRPGVRGTVVNPIVPRTFFTSLGLMAAA